MDIAGILRTICTGIGLDPQQPRQRPDRNPLITVHPLSVALSAPTLEDNAYTILRTDPLLLVFLFRPADSRRCMQRTEFTKN